MVVKFGLARFLRTVSAAALGIPLLLAAAPAEALVTATLLQNLAATDVYGATLPSPGASRIDVNNGATFSYTGVTFDAESRLTSSDLFFKNGVITSSGSSSMKTGVAVTFTNTYNFAYRPVLQSTLVAAGMGLSVVNMNQINDHVGDILNCNPAQLKNCGTVDGGAADYKSSFTGNYSGFDYDMSVNGTSIYSLTGRVSQDADANFVADFADSSGSGRQADQILTNFKQTIDSDLSQAYSWDDTVVEVALPDLLQPGESVTIDFTVTTYGFSRGGYSTRAPDGTALGYIPLAYASFGDPTGGKDSANNFARSLFAAPPLALDGVDTNSYATFMLPTETVDLVNHTVTASLEGESTFVAKSASPYAQSAVPEPSSWALLIAGFGMIGGTMRRMRKRAPAI